MAREPIEKVIDGDKFIFYQLPPRKSLNLLLRIFKIIGSPLGNAIGSNQINQKGILDSNIDIGSVVTSLCEKINVTEVELIINELVSQVICEGQGEVLKNFDNIFAGKIQLLFKVVYEMLNIEYSGFFGGKSVLQEFLKRTDISQKK